jgi:beta-N-acetylhexosaminidase
MQKPSADPTIDRQTLADRVSGLVMIGFDGLTAADAPVEFIKTLAGAILFARNIVSAKQTADLTRDLQAAARASGSLPLIIAMDQEGGNVTRLPSWGTTIPSAMAFGAAGDPALTERMYRVTGTELAALGVTLDLAPVADVNNNAANPVIGVRSFGEDPIAVGRHVAAAIRGLHAAGIGATAKHFPGHGDTDVDSHLDMPVATHDPARLHAIELEPFQDAARAGVDAIMTAHIALPSADPSGVPATLSRTVLTGILRGEFGFSGVICTDCMEMKAVADRYPSGEAAVMAVGAGADLVLYSSSVAAARDAVAALQRAVVEGRLDAAQVESSLNRVIALRALYAGVQSGDIASVGSESHRSAALAAAAMATTIVRDSGSVLPLRLEKGQKLFLVQFEDVGPTPEATGKQSTLFGKLLARGAARVQEQIRSLDPAGHEYKQLLMASGSADVIVAVTRRAWMHRLQAQAIEDLALAGKAMIVVAAREPYDASVAPPAAAVIATYGDDDASMEAAADVILGSRTAVGRLPVTIAPSGVSENGP